MYKNRLMTALTAVCAVCAVAAVPAAKAAPVGEPVLRPAQMVAQPARAYLTAVTQAGQRLVAVGERGVIVLSDDGGKTWRQVKVPVSVTLAAVQFPTPAQGWAVGHYGVVLHTSDGGETWTRQLDGMQAAHLVLQDAQGAQKTDAYRMDAARLVADGPDKPFLALHFGDEKNGIVVGAYNLALRTHDGGKTWVPLSGHLDNPKASHLYAVHTAGNDIYIAGEQGLLLRSADGGENFDRVNIAYKGSFFAIGQAGKDIVLAGLGGNAFRSADKGASWQKLDVPAPVSITAISARGSKYLMTNQAGMLLAGSAGAGHLLPIRMKPLPPLNDVLSQADGSIVVVGTAGVLRLPAPAHPVSMAAQ